jgi:hypothetical protein
MIRTYGFAEGGLLNHSYMHGSCGSMSPQYAVGPRPEEIVALLYEYSNMTNREGEYALYSQSSKDKVPLEQYKATLKQDVSMSVTDYVFPSVEVEGDHATIEFEMTYSTPEESDLQLKTTLEAVLEAEGWRVVMLDEQVEHFLGADS